jgi:hypothetical protein
MEKVGLPPSCYMFWYVILRIVIILIMLGEDYRTNHRHTFPPVASIKFTFQLSITTNVISTYVAILRILEEERN